MSLTFPVCRAARSALPPAAGGGRRRRSRGFTLVEVLVALVIFSIGLLAVASMQVDGIRHTHASHVRLQAIQLMQSIVDSMYANEAVMRDPASPYLEQTQLTSVSTNCLALAADTTLGGHVGPVCDPTQLARLHVFDWQRRVAGSLPQGAGAICRDDATDFDDGVPSAWDCTGSGVLTVKIAWTDEIDEAGNAVWSLLAQVVEQDR